MRLGAPLSSGLVACERQQAVQDPRAARPYAVVLELVRHERAQAADRAGRGQGVVGVDVHVVVVDGRGDGDLVGGEAVGVVQRGPVGAFGEEVGRFAEGAQGRVAVEGPGVDGLAGEEDRAVAREGLGGVELREVGADPLGGPGGGAVALRVAGLVDQCVQRVPGVREEGLDVLLEGVGEGRALGGADEGVLQEVVQAVAALAAAEEDAEGLEGLDGEAVAAVQDGLVPQEVLGDAPGALDILGVTRVMGGDLALDARVGGPVDVVGVAVEGGQAAGDQGGAEALGRGGEVVDRAEAAEALAEDGPGGAAGDCGADRLAVANDGVGAEQREVVGLFAGAAAQRRVCRLAGVELPVPRWSSSRTR